jgi:hypothetical protein
VVLRPCRPAKGPNADHGVLLSTCPLANKECELVNEHVACSERQLAIVQANCELVKIYEEKIKEETASLSFDYAAKEQRLRSGRLAATL